MAHNYSTVDDFWGAQVTDIYDDFALSKTPYGSPTRVVCDTGDVILVADDGTHPALKIKVSSVVLSVASKVFKTLFRSGFAEAQAIRNSPHALVEIRISDPPCDALLLFLSLAVIIDKYDCTEALRHVAYARFSALELSNYDQEEHFYYVTAAWILDQPKFFRQLTKDLVIYYEVSPTQNSDSCLNVLPSEVLVSIRSQRSFAGLELTYHLGKFVAKYHTAAIMLGHPAYSNELTQHMLACDLWPLDLRSHPLHFLFHDLRECHVPIMQADKLRWSEAAINATDTSNATSHIVEPPTKFDINHVIERIELFCVGLCLDCFKGNDTCRVPHSDPFSKDLWIPL